jgi:hypothetical protein
VTKTITPSAESRASAEAERAARPRRGVGRTVAGVVLVVMLLAGLLVRLDHIADPALDYHPARQYHSALIARNYALGNGGTMQQRVAAKARAALIEPPILELATAAVWRVTGSESLWVAGVISSLVWLLGAWFLYALARRLANRLAGLAAAAVFLFVPVGILGSRVFQPDPLLVTAMIGAVLAIVVDDDRPSRRSLVVAGLAAGFAIFTKDVGIFFVLPVFAALAWMRPTSTGPRQGARFLLQRRTWVFALLALVPMLVYTVWGWWITPFLASESGGRILPHLLTTGFFWSGWWGLATLTVPLGVLVVAAAGLFAGWGRGRLVLGMLIAGYVSFGLLFTYHYATHSYYHLPLIFVAALGVGLTFGRLERWWVESDEWSIARVGVATAAVMLTLVGIATSSVPILPAPADPGAVRQVEDGSTAVGRLVHHDTRLIMLAPADTELLRWYGYVAGLEWPSLGQDTYTRLQGQQVGTIRAQLDADSKELGGAHYFVVTDMVEWHNQPALRAYLAAHYPLVASAPIYRIYDLRHPLVR